MQLSPLQSRLAASLIASCLLILLYLSLFSPHFALAAELSSPRSPLILFEDLSIEGRSDDVRIRQPDYEPQFEVFDRSIIGRAPPGVTALVNNVPQQLNLEPGSTQQFVFEKASILAGSDQASTIELRGEPNGSREEARAVEEREAVDSEALQEKAGIVRRQSTKTIYISANACMQPQANADATTMEAPQLTMYVSTSPQNLMPGPGTNNNLQTWHVFNQGAVMVNVSRNDDVYIGIHAANVSTEFFTGGYNFEVAASIDDWYHSYDEQVDPNLIWVDSDRTSALLITRNLTDSADPAMAEAMMTKQPYVMFAQNENDGSINGMRFSFCGLQNYAQIAATKNGKLTGMVSTDVTRRGQGGLPKQEFYFNGLNASTSYVGILAANGNAGTTGDNVIGGGGHVSRATTFATKSVGGNCEVIFNLTFCNETAYAVPSNPTKLNSSALAQVYDDYAKSMYDTFLKVLAQIPCEAPSTQRYSLARNCADCEAAYKTWLCSVTIPRCEDFSVTDDWLQPRGLGQGFPDGTSLPSDVLAQFPLREAPAFAGSRNPNIDTVIAPGPYKEVLPCDDVCYNLVKSCPSAMGFGCPRPGSPGFNTSYGRRTAADNNGSVTCNYPGSAHFFSGAAAPRLPLVSVVGFAGILALLLL